MAEKDDLEYDEYMETTMKTEFPYEYSLLKTPVLENMKKRVYEEPKDFMEPLKVHGKAANAIVNYSNLVLPKLSNTLVTSFKEATSSISKDSPSDTPKYKRPWLIIKPPNSSPGQQ